MAQMSKMEMWDLAIEVAKDLQKFTAPEKELEGMNKEDFAKYDARLPELPAKWRDTRADGGDEDDTLEYFKTLVKFHIAVLKNPNKKG